VKIWRLKNGDLSGSPFVRLGGAAIANRLLFSRLDPPVKAVIGINDGLADATPRRAFPSLSPYSQGSLGFFHTALLQLGEERINGGISLERHGAASLELLLDAANLPQVPIRCSYKSKLFWPAISTNQSAATLAASGAYLGEPILAKDSKVAILALVCYRFMDQRSDARKGGSRSVAGLLC
jgi:hypothetical protein